MRVPPPELRRCDLCLNNITLNLFRLNSSVCRYCQDGMPLPKRLVSNPHKEMNVEVSTESGLNSQTADLQKESVIVQQSIVAATKEDIQEVDVAITKLFEEESELEEENDNNILQIFLLVY